jgi:4-oxalocrotonate tautomerase
MPLVQINVPEGSLDAARKAEMIAKVTDAVIEVEGSEAVRPYTWVHVNEVPDGGWGMGGTAWPLAKIHGALASSTDD